MLHLRTPTSHPLDSRTLSPRSRALSPPSNGAESTQQRGAIVEVERSQWDGFLSEIEPRLVPHERDGAVVGCAFFGIRPAMQRLGLVRGRLVIEVNGVPLTHAAPIEGWDPVKIVQDQIALARHSCSLSFVSLTDGKRQLHRASCKLRAGE